MEFTVPSINFAVILPVLIVGLWGVLVMVVDLIILDDSRPWSAWLSMAGLALAAVQTLALWNAGYQGGTFTPADGTPMIVIDGYVHFLNIIFLLTGAFSILISQNYLGKTEIVERAEYYMLILFSISGMMLMGMANDLILVFLALELLSIPLYVLSGMARPRLESEEAGMKYFLLGAFSSGFLVYGIALIYGATGSTALPEVAANFAGSGALGLTGLGLALVGFGFKVGAVPFHMWTPDVYEGAPTAVTAFMSVGAKVGGFAAMIRFFVANVPLEMSDQWVLPVAIISALTMILGNVVALAQTNIKRLLAYSSIAHGGYIMMAVAAAPASDSAVSAALYYMLAYTFTNMGAFALAIMVEHSYNEGVALEEYKGLAQNNLGLALVLGYFMMSLIGIPLTGGFLGKFFVFRSALDAGLVWLAVVGVLTSVVSAYYYLRVVFYMFMFEGKGKMEAQPALMTTVVITTAATLILGIIPAPWFELAQNAVLTAGQTLIAGG